jgi:hypothetical protein
MHKNKLSSFIENVMMSDGCAKLTARKPIHRIALPFPGSGTPESDEADLSTQRVEA